MIFAWKRGKKRLETGFNLERSFSGNYKDVDACDKWTEERW
jgi:hypothetical protein